MADPATQGETPPSTHNSIEKPKNEYLVMYKPGVTDEQRREHEAAIHAIVIQKPGFDGIRQSWNMGAFQGYHIHMDPEDLAQIDYEFVSCVEPNVVATVYLATTADDAKATGSMVNQAPSTWGLGRISHRDKGYYNYVYDDSAGEGVKIYVLDTGINIDHSDFGGRASWGVNYVPNSLNTDENGHGTHCAGTAIGTKYGVAKKAYAIAVKVLDRYGFGDFAGIINGILWAYYDAGSNRDKAVISMSLGGPYSQVMNYTVAAAAAAGMTVSVAAGNDNNDVKYYSPASEPSAVTVAAIDWNDYRYTMSNWGAGVDVFAAGVSVTSDWIGTNDATNTISGTSMVNAQGSPNRIAYNNSGY
ncbi:hypothetical protein CDV36_016262 [Fusarium kuroshium]|uniref:Peptidase S8/S53 domain-containing protein n=1 Tax=Fusarium kuroshium TaxID=2010991 RepID=A0A3M2QWC0_9HYPO|nr:hypothetical protein CDV36_016262 [Fusarium kuroshium]